MKTRRRRKLLLLIEDDDLPRLRRYMKKHRISVDCVLDHDQSTPLHVACRLGNDAIVDFLLKTGADVMLCNVHGQLSVHLACVYMLTTQHKHVYTDLVEPLITHCPRSIDVPDDNGVTARQMLERAQISVSNEDEVEDDYKECPDERWNDRLQEEMMDEYGEMCGSYDQDHHYDGHKPDTYDGWADKMSEEYHKNHSYNTNYRPGKRKKSTQETNNEQPKKPRISQEKLDSFRKKLKEEYDSLKENEARKAQEEQKNRKKIYEERCSSVFSGNYEGTISYTDIPWPFVRELSEDAILDFLFCDLVKGTRKFQKYLKEQQVRWHPDRFKQKCGSRLEAENEVKINTRVKEISQILNAMMEDIS